MLKHISRENLIEQSGDPPTKRNLEPIGVAVEPLEDERTLSASSQVHGG